MDILTADQLLEHAQSQPIVNERPPRLLTAEQLLAPETEQAKIDREIAAERRQIALPKTWFGEFWNAAKTGVDQLQQLGYQSGAMASDAVGFDSLQDWFIKGSEQQDKEIAGQPINVEDSSDIQGFDSFMRWFSGAAGKAVPQLAEAAAATALGAVAGSAIGPEGTLGGAVEGFVGREAVKNALKKGVANLVTEGVESKLVSKELKDYARGKITKDAMSDPAKDIMVNEFRNIMSKYGADAALLTNSVGQETASIYQDSADLPDSDRKVNALIGGLIAGALDFIPDAYIANKFFPGAGRVTHAQVKEADSYVKRLGKAAGKELPKVFAIEGGTEYLQTLVEFAAHNYADPEKRDAIFDYTPDQLHQAMEAAKQGGVGGLIGGGVSALQTARHPNPMVRQAEADIKQKAADIDPLAADMAGPEDKQLSAILTQQRDLQAVVADPATEEKVKVEAQQKIDDLEKEANKILGVTESGVAKPFVNEKTQGAGPAPTPFTFDEQGNPVTTAPAKVEPEPVVPVVETPKQPTILERGIEHLKTFYEKVLPRSPAEPIDQEAVTRQRDKVTAIINENIKGQEDTPEAKQYSEAIHSGLTDQTLHFLDVEGVDIRFANPTDVKKGMRPSDAGVLNIGRKGIALILPTLEGAKRQANKLALAGKPTSEDRAPFIKHLHDIMGHEIAHVADYVNIRNKWQANSKGLTFGQYLQTETEGRGAALRLAYPKIKDIINPVYNMGEIKEMDDSRLGDEAMRMAIEFARQGKIQEITTSLAMASQQEKAGGPIKNFLYIWLKAISEMKDILMKMIGQDAPISFKQDLHDINQMLDKYGVLVNDNQLYTPEELAQAKEVSEKEGKLSRSLIQRRLRMGYAKSEAIVQAIVNERKLNEQTKPEAPAPREEAAPVVEQHPNAPLGTKPVNKGTQVVKPTKQERAKERLDKSIKAAKKEGKPIVDAMRSHIRYQKSQGLEPDFKAFKAIYGKGATSTVYHEVAKSFVNEKVSEKGPAMAARFQGRDFVELHHTGDLKRPKVPYFLGIHLGTKKSAESRALSQGRPAPKVYNVNLKGGRVINWDEEVGRREAGFQSPVGVLEDILDVIGVTREDQYNIVNSIPLYMSERLEHFRRVEEEMAKLGVIGIEYTNHTEHKGSQSLLIFDKNRLTAIESETTNPEDIAKSLNLEYKGVMMDMLDLYNDMLPGSPSFGTTIAVKVGSTLEQVSDKVEETRAKFGAVPPEKGPAMAARATAKQKNTAEVIAKKVNAPYARNLGTIIPKPAESRQSGIAAFWQGVSPTAIRYESQTKTQSTLDAQQAINRVGDALKVARILVDDPRADTLGLTNSDPDSIIPAASVAALYQQVARQLADLNAAFVNENVGKAAKDEVVKLFKMVTRRITASMPDSGAFGAVAGAPESIFNGISTRTGYIESIMESIGKVIGKGKREDLHKLAEDLNEQGVKYTPVVSFSPKVISAVRKIYEKMTDVKFQKGSRETILSNLKRVVRMVNKAAARAANIIAQDDDGEARAQKRAESLIAEMTGSPRDVKSKTEDALFYQTAVRFARTTATQMGLIVKPAKTEKAMVAQAMATILKNGEAYQRFAQQLFTAYVAEYGGQNPDAHFMEQAELFYNRVMDKQDGQDLIGPLVNEKMRELEMKFAKIAQLKYSEGNFSIETLAAAIQVEMKEQGVTDPAIMSQLAHDIDVEVQAQLEKARDKFFGSSKTIKGFLETIGFSLRDAAASLRVHADSVEGQLRELLISEYGFPDTAQLPIASDLAKVMQNEINALVEGENAARIQRFLDDAQKALNNPTEKRQVNMRKAVERLLELTKLGIVRQEDIYNAIAEQFPELPKYSEELADQIEALGDKIYNAQHPRQVNELKQQLADLMKGSRPLKTTDAWLASMYNSMLNSPSTWLVANPVGNTSQLIAYIGQVMAQSITKPRLIYPMFQALFKTAMGKGFWEARETFYNGMQLGKQTSKYLTTRSPFELKDPYFTSPIDRGDPGWFGAFKDKLAAADEKTATLAFKLSRAIGGKFIMRSLVAADIFFHKIAEELAYTYKTGGKSNGTQAMFISAMDQARQTMLAVGENPDDSKEMRSRMMVLANSILERERLNDADGNFVNERVVAWQEAHAEGLRVTLNQEPKGMFGALHRLFNRLADQFPVARLFVPFTRIAANQMNMALEFTPWGLARFAMGGEFMINKGGTAVLQDDGTFDIEGGEPVRDQDLIWRSVAGTLGLFALFGLMSSQDDDDDPYFWIYGSGPRDKTKKGLLMERGWKPNTVKIGDNYYNYLLTPLSIVFSMVGYHADKYLDGQLPSPYDVGVSSTMVAMMDSVKNQSFLSTLADFASAVDSPDPEGRLNKIFARTAGVVVPNAVKWLDRITNPTIQEAKTFKEVLISEIPLVRMALKPRLNYFGEPITRAQGIFPGLDRIATAQRSDDPVVNFLSDHNLDLPGYSKSTRLLNNAMSAEQFYDYVQLAGPEIKKGIRANLSELELLDHEQQKDMIERIARDAKAKARKFIIDRDKVERLQKK